MTRHQRHGDAPSNASGSASGPSATPGKRTLTGCLPIELLERSPTRPSAPGKQTLTGSMAGAAAADNAPATPSSGMWDHTFGQASTAVGKLGRVQAPRGVYLRVRPLPAAESSGPLVPFSGLIHVVRQTTQPRANQRWCYVIATEAGIAGFCEERYLAIDPPEPTATLRRTAAGERLAVIAEEVYGRATQPNNARLQVQALYLANRDRAGIQLDDVDLSFKHTALRSGDEERTLEIYKGAKVLAGHSLWIPSRSFIEQLKAAGVITGGATYASEAWNTAKEAIGTAVDGAKYAAGFTVGILEGAYKAIVDLFKGAVDMVEAVLEVVWNLVINNLGRIKDMVTGWVDKMKLAWEHRGQIADDFLRKWNADNVWDRGLFQGEVLGWLAMTVLLILVTVGEGAPAALGSIAVRWPQLVKLLKTVDTLGDVTSYLGAAAKAAKLPGKVADFVAGKMGKLEPSAVSSAKHARQEVEHARPNIERETTQPVHGGDSSPLPARRAATHRRTVTVHGLAQKPKTYPWTKNPHGAVRTADDVKRLAHEHGVEIEHDIEIFAVGAKWLPPDTYAQYMNRAFQPGQRVRWEDFYNKYDSIAVKISKDVLDSDEAIVAIMAHEMHELNNLRKIFAERGTISVEELWRMINPGLKGNLHDHAWDVADALVARMRARGLQ